MKIGKITFDGYNNYGNSLQSFALQEYLKEQGHEVDSLWHSPHERLSEFWKWGVKEDVKFLINHGSFRDEIKNGVRAWELARRARGMDFTQRNINVRYDVNNLRDIESEYDFFIVGSDQVWNPNNPDLSTAFLQFTNSCKRISFAASIGAQNIPSEICETFKNGLLGMKAISVREKRAAEIIYEMTGRHVEVILDPVFCVDEDKWREISVRPYWLKSKGYLFAYFLGDIPEYVKDIAELKKLEIISSFDKSSIDRYIMSPEEWLYLISNAQYVCTDSFHATAFSIIFNRDFTVFPREGTNENRQMITRIESLLKTFSLTECLFNGKITSGTIYKDNVKKIIEKELRTSDIYLKNALSI